MISLLCPSRYRPAELVEMATAALMLADRPADVEIVARVDLDDPRAGDYLAALEQIGGRGVFAPRAVMSGLWDEAARAASGDVVMVAADDLRFRSRGWDTAVTAAFDEEPDRLVLVYGRDGAADEAMATHPFLHRRWLEVLGRICPPYFSADYADLWVFEIAEAVGRSRFLSDVWIEHMHYSLGKGPLDECHRERLARARSDPPEQAWERSAGERHADIDKMREAMELSGFEDEASDGGQAR